MTDIMFTRTALTEAAENAGITPDQARTILEAAGVAVQPPPGLYLMAHPSGPRPVLVDQDGSLALISDEGDMLEGLVSSAEESKALTPARAVPVTAAPVSITEDQVGELWDAVTASDPEASIWVDHSSPHRARIKATVNAALAQYAASAEGEPIAPEGVRWGDRVRLVSKSGDEATFTVRTVAPGYLRSEKNLYDISNIHSIHLLHRKDQP